MIYFIYLGVIWLITVSGVWVVSKYCVLINDGSGRVQFSVSRVRKNGPMRNSGMESNYTNFNKHLLLDDAVLSGTLRGSMESTMTTRLVKQRTYVSESSAVLHRQLFLVAT